MKYTYSVNEENFLNFQLYHVSQTDEFKSKIKRQPLMMLALNAALGFYFLAEKDYLYASAFFGFGVIFFFLYPMRIKRMYKARFLSEIQKKFSKHFGAEAHFEILEDAIRTSDNGGVSEKKYRDVSKIVHLPEETLILFRNKQTFILPKATTENYEEMVENLNKKADKIPIKVEELKGWKW